MYTSLEVFLYSDIYASVVRKNTIKMLYLLYMFVSVFHSEMCETYESKIL